MSEDFGEAGYRREEGALRAQRRFLEYWLVDPEARSIERLSLASDGYGPPTRYVTGERAVSLLVPGFALAVDNAFEDT